MTLVGRGALVTGGGRGIGAETARALARAGARVVVAARSVDEVEATAAGIRDAGGEAWAVRCDVTDEDAVAALVAEARSAMGAVDVLVNNAGTATSNPLARVTLAEWHRVMDVNATGTFLCTRAAVPAMVEGGFGRVVNVASVAGLRGGRYITAYTAAKHAVVGFTRAVAVEVAGTGVTANAVCPGYVDTPMTDQSLDRIVEKTGAARDEALRRLLEHSDQARLITPAEVADAVVALCLAPDTNGTEVVLEGSGPVPTTRNDHA